MRLTYVPSPTEAAAQEVQALEARLAEAKRKLAILRDPYHDLKIGEGRLTVRNGRTFVNAVINEGTRWEIEVVE